ncbi:RRQRL motif-containing zinc-binding protein [Actinomadura atramentaria]|uniref:RRQRL motif-containing zinc-binding protein n=1 Tax=Actinomadura atramentaria TaxID=1990 RepID=UPI000525C721|nr:RRQRL motif-containing zinc-binding protein [Actinomadura atramentaria]
MGRRSSALFYDPTGARYGIPTYPWRMAPAHLLTVRQLAARGKRPGGQSPVAQVLWRSRRYSAPGGVRVAYLYDVRLALPKRVPTERQRAALAKALKARRVCPDCGRDAGYVLSRRLGLCLDCADWEDIAA